jgi:ribosomal protein S18 acetylase RimI-like enzyme
MSGKTGFTPAAALDLAALTVLWNRAYAGYFVPIVFDDATMARHLRRAGVDLGLSLVVQVDGEACGLSLAARRDVRGYIAGFGIAAERRRQGLAGRLIAAQLERLRDAGVRQAQLEVIAVNPARAVYRAAGFADGRVLQLLAGTLDDGPAGAPPTVEPLDAAALAQAHAALHGAALPTWRRQLPTLLGALAHDGAEAVALRHPDGRWRACAVLVDAPAQPAIGLLDAVADDEAAGRALAAALAARHPGRAWRLGDEAADTPLNAALRACGWQAGLEQVEMHAALR